MTRSPISAVTVLPQQPPLNQAMAGRSQESSARTPLVLVGAFLVTAVILFAVLPAVEKITSYSYNVKFVDGYDLIANNLASGNGYRWTANMSETMMREPGCPLFLAAIFKVFGYHIEAVRAANWLLTIGIALMILRLTRVVTNDPSVGLIASLLFLFHPGTLIAEARGGVEILFIFVTLVFMLTLHHAVEKGGLLRYLLAGLALGVVVQVRSTPLVFPLLLLCYLGFIAKGTRARVKTVLNIATVVLGTVIVMTPWIIRNYRLIHEFVPVATLNGVALQEGQYTCRGLSVGQDFAPLGRGAGAARGELATKLGLRFEGAQYFQVFYDAHDEWAFNKLLLRTAAQEYFQDPGLWTKCAGKNIFNFWFLGRNWRVTGLNMALQVPFLVMAFSGLYLLHKRGLLPRMGIMLTFVFSIMAVHLPIVAEARYSVPVLVFLTIPAGVAIVTMWRKYGSKDKVNPQWA